jgi:hypothetical protein
LNNDWVCQISSLESFSEVSTLSNGPYDTIEFAHFEEEPLEESLEQAPEPKKRRRKSPKKSKPVKPHKPPKSSENSSTLLCPVCLNTFTNDGSLKRHLKRFHQVSVSSYDEAANGTSDVIVIRQKLNEMQVLGSELPDIEICCLCQLPLVCSGRSRGLYLRHCHNITSEEYKQ